MKKKQATLIDGPLDELKINVEADEVEIKVQSPCNTRVLIYQTYGPEGKTFNFIQYAKLVEGEKIYHIKQ